MIRKPTPKQILAYRDKHEISTKKATRALWKQWRMATLELLQLQSALLRPPTTEGRVLCGMIETIADYLAELEKNR